MFPLHCETDSKLCREGGINYVEMEQEGVGMGEGGYKMSFIHSHLL